VTAAATTVASGWVTAALVAVPSAMAVVTVVARAAGMGVGDSGGNGCSKGGQYPRD
jgi:hypothetical protein